MGFNVPKPEKKRKLEPENQALPFKEDKKIDEALKSQVEQTNSVGDSVRDDAANAE